MKLNIKVFRYLSQDDWRVLTAVEMGSKNHEVVPTQLIIRLASLRTGSNGVEKCISTLAKADLIARVRNTKYDGYRLTYGGFDYLALHAHTKSSSIVHLGSQMGVGKESDIYLVTSPAAPNTVKPVQSILKIHRLGRTSFRSLTRNRAYHRHRHHCSWQYLSRLSAEKEFAAMRALYVAGFPVPQPIAWNRHTIVMSLLPGLPLKDVPLSAFSHADSAGDSQDSNTAKHRLQEEKIASLYASCIELALQLASHGLIHGDLNEFNILVGNVPGAFEDSKDDLASLDQPSSPHTTPSATDSHPSDEYREMEPYLIDFPQITSMSHSSAEFYFKRDISGIKAFFRKRYHFEPENDGPTFAEALSRLHDSPPSPVNTANANSKSDKSHPTKRLDIEIEAAGFSKKMARDLDDYFAETNTSIENDEVEHHDLYDDPEEPSDEYIDEEGAESENYHPPLDQPNNSFTDISTEIPPSEDIGIHDKLSALSLQAQADPPNQAAPRKSKAAAGWSI